MAQAKSSGSAFLAILASVSDEDVSGDELADTSANTHADTQTANLTTSHKEFAVFESATDDRSDRRISATTSGAQRNNSHEASFNIRANSLTYASSKIANGRHPLALSDRADEAPSAKVTVTSLPSQPSAQSLPPVVVVQPKPAGELAKPAPPRALVGTATIPLTSETNPHIASPLKITASPSQQSAQSVPPSIVVQPMPASELAKGVSARTLMEIATRPLTSQTNPPIASAVKITASSSQPSAQSIPPSIVVQPRPASELAKAVSTRALMETAARSLTSDTNPPIESTVKVPSSSPQSSVEIGPRANPVPKTFARASLDESSIGRLVKDGTMAPVEESSVAISSAQNVSALSEQTSAQNTHPRLTIQTTAWNVSVQKISVSNAKETGSNSNTEEANILIPSANAVPIVPAKPAVQTNASGIAPQSFFVAAAEQANSAISGMDTAAKTHADALTAHMPSANAVPITPPKFAVQTNSSPITPQSSFTVAPQQSTSPTSLINTDATAHYDELTMPNPSPVKVSAASPQIPQPVITPREMPQPTFASIRDQQAPGIPLIETNTNTTGANTAPRESNVLAGSQTSPPIPSSPPSTQASSSDDSIQQAFAIAPKEEISGSGSKDTGQNPIVETGAEHMAESPSMDTPIIDVASNTHAIATASEPALVQDKAEDRARSDQSLSAPRNVASKDNGSSPTPAQAESTQATPAGVVGPARGTVARAAQQISAPEGIAEPQNPFSATPSQLPATDPQATDPSATGKVQKFTTVVARVQTVIDTSVAPPFATGTFTGSVSLSAAAAPTQNESGNQVLQGPVKKESYIVAAMGNPVLANAANTGTKQSTDTASKAADGSAHAAQSDPPSTQNSQAGASHIAEAAPKTGEGGPMQSSSAQAQAVSIQPAIPQATRTDRAASTADLVPLPVPRQQIPASIRGEGGEAPATSSINTAKLMQTMGESEMHIGMNSTEFGEISIRTSIAQQQMVTQISLDHGGLSQAISAHVSTMQTKLSEDYGLKASIEVHNLGSSHSGEPGQSSQKEQKAFAGSTHTHSASLPQPEEASLSLAALATPGSPDRLDIRA